MFRVGIVSTLPNAKPNTMPTRPPAVPRAEHQRRLKSFTRFCEARGIGPAALKATSGGMHQGNIVRLRDVCHMLPIVHLQIAGSSPQLDNLEGPPFPLFL
jgi:hypothetical protein